MGYFTDVLDILLWKDRGYKRVGNNPRAFGTLVIVYFTIFYAFEFVTTLLIGAGIAILRPGLLDLSSDQLFELSLVAVAVFVLAPVVIFVINYLVTYIQHLIGKMFGGRPQSYNDFFKVFMYPLPLFTPLLLVDAAASSWIFTIWQGFILYKTYMIIHKLTPSKAGWAIVINIVLYVILASIIIIIFFFIEASFPGTFDRFIK